MKITPYKKDKLKRINDGWMIKITIKHNLTKIKIAKQNYNSQRASYTFSLQIAKLNYFWAPKYKQKELKIQK